MDTRSYDLQRAKDPGNMRSRSQPLNQELTKLPLTQRLGMGDHLRLQDMQSQIAIKRPILDWTLR